MLSGGLDLVYQFFVQSSIHIRAAIIVAFVLAVVPYVIVRGTVTRIANSLMTRPPTVPDRASGEKTSSNRGTDDDRT